MIMNGRLDGHIVQDMDRRLCTDVKEADGSWYYTFEYAFDKEMAQQGYMTVERIGFSEWCKPYGFAIHRLTVFRWLYSPYTRLYKLRSDRERNGWNLELISLASTSVR